MDLEMGELGYSEEEGVHELYGDITTKTQRREYLLLNYDPYGIPENTENQEDEEDFSGIF